MNWQQSNPQGDNHGKETRQARTGQKTLSGQDAGQAVLMTAMKDAWQIHFENHREGGAHYLVIILLWRYGDNENERIRHMVREEIDPAVGATPEQITGLLGAVSDWLNWNKAKYGRPAIRP